MICMPEYFMALAKVRELTLSELLMYGETLERLTRGRGKAAAAHPDYPKDQP